MRRVVGKVLCALGKPGASAHVIYDTDVVGDETFVFSESVEQNTDVLFVVTTRQNDVFCVLVPFLSTRCLHEDKQRRRETETHVLLSCVQEKRLSGSSSILDPLKQATFVSLAVNGVRREDSQITPLVVKGPLVVTTMLCKEILSVYRMFEDDTFLIEINMDRVASLGVSCASRMSTVLRGIVTDDPSDLLGTAMHPQVTHFLATRVIVALLK